MGEGVGHKVPSIHAENIPFSGKIYAFCVEQICIKTLGKNAEVPLI